MSVYLMPQPQKIEVAKEGVPFDADKLQALIRCPADDDRLLRCARQLFGGASMQNDGEDYCLCAGDAQQMPAPPRIIRKVMRWSPARSPSAFEPKRRTVCFMACRRFAN